VRVLPGSRLGGSPGGAFPQTIRWISKQWEGIEGENEKERKECIGKGIFGDGKRPMSSVLQPLKHSYTTGHTHRGLFQLEKKTITYKMSTAYTSMWTYCGQFLHKAQ